MPRGYVCDKLEIRFPFDGRQLKDDEVGPAMIETSEPPPAGSSPPDSPTEVSSVPAPAPLSPTAEKEDDAHLPLTWKPERH